MWPLLGLVVTDAIGIAILARYWLDYSITSAVAASYVGTAMGLVQLPLCILGMVMCRKLPAPTWGRVYLGHMALTIVLGISTNIDMT